MLKINLPVNWFTYLLTLGILLSPMLIGMYLVYAHETTDKEFFIGLLLMFLGLSNDRLKIERGE
jgi:hypothetical protein